MRPWLDEPDRSGAWSRMSARPSARAAVDLGFHLGACLRAAALEERAPDADQSRTLRRLVRRARATRFGRDHHFERIGGVADFQAAVPLRDYEALWADYLRERCPVLENLTWPGRAPFLALTSGTTAGTSKYVPVTAEMVASNQKAARTMLAYHYRAHPDARLFRGRLFFLGGSAALRPVAEGVVEGDLSGIAAVELAPFFRPFTFPALEDALEPDWDRKLTRLAELSRREPITLVGGVPSWLWMLFQRVLAQTGRRGLLEVWPGLEVIVHGGVKFEPYRETFRALMGETGAERVRFLETYACSEGFIAFGDPETELLRLVFDHGLFYEFVPVEDLGAERPARHWLGNVQTGVNYAIAVSTCAGLWAHLIGDTVRFESVRPPLLTFTGRTRQTLSAFGEHLILEELEGAVARSARAVGASVLDWHVGPCFGGVGAPGRHHFVVEFLGPPPDLVRFGELLDADLARRNADYQAHRAPGAGLPAPVVSAARAGAFADWMRRRGRLGGQNKVPRVDASGEMVRDLLGHLAETGQLADAPPRGPA